MNSLEDMIEFSKLEKVPNGGMAYWADMDGVVDPNEEARIMEAGKRLRMSVADIKAVIKAAKDGGHGVTVGSIEVDGMYEMRLVPTQQVADVLVEEDEHYSAPGGMLAVYGGDPNMHYCWITTNNSDQKSAAYQIGYLPVSKLGASGRGYTIRKGDDGKSVIMTGDLTLFACPRDTVERRQIAEQRQRDRDFGELFGQEVREFADNNGLKVGTRDELRERLAQEDDNGASAMMAQDRNVAQSLAEAKALAQHVRAERASARERGSSFFGQVPYGERQFDKIFPGARTR